MKPLVSVDELRKLMPKLSLAKAGEYAPLLSVSMREFGVVSKKHRCSYLSQLAVESLQLTRWVENLNYSAHRLTQVWPGRFPSIAAAAPYAMNPQALAEKVYGGRMGNTKAGDGWKYRGRFPIQATGGDMYRKAAKALKVTELATDPDTCLDDKLIGFRVSAWIFAVEKGCNRLAEDLRLDGSAHDRAIQIEICERINGGHHGLSDRLNYFRIAKQVLHNDDDQDPSSPQSPVAPPAIRPAESVHEQESAEGQAASPAIVSAEPESDLLGAAVKSEVVKKAAPKLWPRLSGLGVYHFTLYQTNQIIGNILIVIVLAGVGCLVYWKWSQIKIQLRKLLQ
jgi:putative chitinase